MEQHARRTRVQVPHDAAATPWPWPVWALAGSMGGVALQLQQAALWPVGAYVVLLVAGLAVLWRLCRGHGRRGAPWLAVLALMAGALISSGGTGWRACGIAAQALDPALEGVDLVVTGLVDQMPQRVDGNLRFRLAVASAARAEGAGEGGGAVVLPPLLSLGWYAERERADTPPPAALPALHAGERWRMTVRLKAPHGSLNPHGFDYELWAWEQGIGANGSVRDGPRAAPPQRLAATWRRPVERLREATRDAIFAQVADAPAAGIIAALVTGDQAAIERDDWAVFRTTGVAHLMSISGLHITMFAWLAVGVGGALWRRSARLMLAWPAPQAALALGVALAAGYALFSGWGVPAQRTVCMLAVVSALRIAGVRWPWPCVWLLACAVVLALDPWALLQAGFWLSFVAVGVLFAAGSVPLQGRSGAKGGMRRVVAAAWRMCREQGVVTLALAPLGALLFQQLSLIGLVANALAIPWVTLVVTPLAMAGIALPLLWDLAAWAVQWLGAVLQWLAALPGASLALAAPPLWAAVAGVLGGVLLVMRLPWSLRLAGLPLLGVALLWQPARPPHGQFELIAADIGQGNAVLVRTARHSLLYDAGPAYGPRNDAGRRVLVPLLGALDERLDLLLLSHRDSDHTGGAAAVLAAQPAARLLASIEPAHPLQALRPAQRCEAGQQWTWDGVRFEVLHPLSADYAAALPPNALSCVLRIDNGQAAALLAGDIGKAQERELVQRGGPLRADVLLVPHHGSAGSSSEELLDAVQPGMAWVQAGYRNRFRHPAPAVTQALRARGVPLVESSRCGAIRWHSEAASAWQCEREQTRRYWRHSPR